MMMKKRVKFTDKHGKRYKFTNDELVTAWNIVDRVDKVDTASLYLQNYCKMNAEDFTTDEWWTLCTTVCELYAKRLNNGANDMIWKSACDEFVKLYEKGVVLNERT